MSKISGCKISISRDQIFASDKTVSHKVALSGSIEPVVINQICVFKLFYYKLLLF
jgi:hypothetical protein